MTAGAGRSTEKLYSPRLLALSASLADFPFDPALPFTAEARSRTCGSTIRLGLDCDKVGSITRIGLAVAACAVGQSSAAIMAGSIRGQNAADLHIVVDQIDHWLSGEGPLPEWTEFDALEAARAHPGRHGAILLPWKAAVEALSSASASG